MEKADPDPREELPDGGPFPSLLSVDLFRLDWVEVGVEYEDTQATLGPRKRKRLTTDLSSSVKSFTVSEALAVSGVLDVKLVTTSADPVPLSFANSVELFSFKGLSESVHSLV